MAKTMLNVYDLATRRKTAVLQNAFDIVETRELNQIYTLTFTLPSTDEKVKFCQPRHYIRWGDTGELYRIKSIRQNDSDTGTVDYECEHVITTLCDNLLFGSFSYGGGSVKTSAVITWLLNRQITKNWKLGTCDFDRKFEYGWEQENLLNALYAIPKEFSTPYKWEFDTTVYPWKISLKSIDSTVNPEYYLRAKSNILSSGTSAEYADICTRIYPLGYGEGVNQLTIRDVNNGLPYLQSPDTIVAQYGLVEKVLVDRRFENPESLKAYAQTMLDSLQTPHFARTFDVTDLYPLTSQNLDDAEVGKICKMTGDDSIAYITKTVHQWDEAGSLQIELSTKATDVASRVADLADRVRIESVYAQGATQLYQHSKDANATPEKGMTLNLYFPSEMRQINKVLLKMELQQFRSYSQATENAGASTRTSSEGGASTQTSTSGGASTQTSTEGGKSTQTSTDGGGSTYTSSSGGDSTQTSTDGGGSTYTSSSGGDSTQTSTSGGGSTYTSSEGGNSTQTSTDGGGSTYTSSSGGNSTQTSTDGGASTQTSSAGGATGSTSTSDGGPSMTFSASATDTENADWSSYVIAHGGTSNLNVSSVMVDGSTSESGSHSHNLWAYTGEVTPPASADYKHSHAINYSGGALSAGGHNHSFVTNSHDHSFSVYSLKHKHSVSISFKNNGNNQSNFSHSHTFSIGSHTHSVSIPNHNHKITIPSHTHTVTIPNHNHKITIPKHSHTVTIPNHNHSITIPKHSHTVTIPNHNHSITIPKHSHTVTIPNHNHSVTVPNHTHKVSIPNHTHNVTIPSHTHTITIPAHKHEITAGIFESGNPTAFDIYVNGARKTTVNDKSFDGDITSWLLNSSNQIPRDTWIDVEIRPNDLAYVVSSVFVQGFVQSRGGGNY